MQRTIVTINCDNCGDHIVTGHEHAVTITMGTDTFHSDWCTNCWQSLRQKLAPEEPELTCECGFVAKSTRGLLVHRKARGHA